LECKDEYLNMATDGRNNNYESLDRLKKLEEDYDTALKKFQNHT